MAKRYQKLTFTLGLRVKIDSERNIDKKLPLYFLTYFVVTLKADE